MKNEFLSHRLAYLLLILGLVVFTLLFLAVWPQHWLQRMVAIGIATFYMGWGVLFHVHTQRISKHVIREYLAMSAVALVLLFIVIG